MALSTPCQYFSGEFFADSVRRRLVLLAGDERKARFARVFAFGGITKRSPVDAFAAACQR